MFSGKPGLNLVLWLVKWLSGGSVCKVKDATCKKAETEHLLSNETQEFSHLSDMQVKSNTYTRLVSFRLLKPDRFLKHKLSFIAFAGNKRFVEKLLKPATVRE